MFFRPEEVDRRSEGVKGFALLVDSLPEPEHDAVGFWPWTMRRRRERYSGIAVMAARANLHGLANHRRDTKSVGRATGVPLHAVGESDNEQCRQGRERVGEVNPTRADPDQVVVIKGDESIMKHIGSSAWRSRDDVFDRDRATLLKEGSQDEPYQRLLPRCAAGRLSVERIEGLQLLRR
jgi:hypothetical protein